MLPIGLWSVMLRHLFLWDFRSTCSAFCLFVVDVLVLVVSYDYVASIRCHSCCCLYRVIFHSDGVVSVSSPVEVVVASFALHWLGGRECFTSPLRVHSIVWLWLVVHACLSLTGGYRGLVLSDSVPYCSHELVVHSMVVCGLALTFCLAWLYFLRLLCILSVTGAVRSSRHFGSLMFMDVDICSGFIIAGHFISMQNCITTTCFIHDCY